MRSLPSLSGTAVGHLPIVRSGGEVPVKLMCRELVVGQLNLTRRTLKFGGR